MSADAASSVSRVLPTSPSFTTYEGYLAVPTVGDAWVRLEGVNSGGSKGCAGANAPSTSSAPAAALRHARLVLGPELEEVLKVRMREREFVRVPRRVPSAAGALSSLHLASFFNLPLIPSPQPHAPAIAARLRDSPSVPAFLLELRALAGRALAEAAALTAGPSSSSATVAAAAALDAAGPAAWETLTASSPCGTRLTFASTDAAGRSHTLVVRLGGGGEGGKKGGGGRLMLRLAADLPPGALPADWAAAPGFAAAPGSPPPLAAALAAWRAALEAAADLWTALDGLDASFRVLDPAPPTRADTHRVLALGGGGGGGGGGGSLEVGLSLARPRGSPATLTFMGAPASIEGPRAALAAFLEGGRWDEGAGPASNLAAALGPGGLLPATTVGMVASTTTPAAAAADEPTGAECAICYAFHLPDEAEDGGGGAGGNGRASATPSIHCPHPRCGRPYHAACLRGWLAALPGARAALGRLAGECPYCGEEVGVEVAG